MTGKLKFLLANSALGSIITDALVNEEGTFIVFTESGDVLYWSIEDRSVIFHEISLMSNNFSFTRIRPDALQFIGKENRVN